MADWHHFHEQQVVRNFHSEMRKFPLCLNAFNVFLQTTWCKESQLWCIPHTEWEFRGRGWNSRQPQRKWVQDGRSVVKRWCIEAPYRGTSFVHTLSLLVFIGGVTSFTASTSDSLCSTHPLLLSPTSSTSHSIFPSSCRCCSGSSHQTPVDSHSLVAVSLVLWSQTN